VQYTGIEQKDHDRQRYAYQQEMPGRCQVQRHGQGAEGGATETGYAPDTVEAGDDIAIIQCLHAERLGIERNIKEVARGAEAKQHEHQLPGMGSKTQQGQHDIKQQGPCQHYLAAAEAAEQVTGYGKHAHEAGGKGKQDGAKLCLAQVQLLLDGGNA